MSDEKKTVTLTIDGRAVEADASASVLSVALEHGVQVPYFCYHPYLSVPGNCRQCQVKVGMPDKEGVLRWMPKLQVSCNTRVAQGMVVDTRDAEVKQAQAANMEFLLINHPLDCPICDQVGECWLQEHAFTAGPGVTRFRENKEHFDKRVDVGPHVLLDKERCIQCTRCIRFCDEVTGTSELALFSRSDRMEVDIFPGRPLDNPYSGNVVDICPVGALTLKEFRFKSRLWFLQTTSTVCPGCARGCSIKVWHRDRSVARITPRHNPEVNKTWICDHGRLLGDALAARERVREPRVDGKVADWEAALAAAAEVLRGAGGRAAAVLGAWSTLEEGELALRLLENLAGVEAGARGQAAAAVPRHDQGEDDGLLLRADRTPNQRGLAALLANRRPGQVELSSLLAQAARKEIGALLVVGEDLLAAGADAGLVDRALAAGTRLVVLAAHESPTTHKAAVVLPAAVFPEVDGTVVSFQGRAQRMNAAYPPPFLARTGFRILSDLAGRLGAAPAAARPRDLLEEIGRAVPALGGLRFEDLGDLGRPLPAAPAAPA